MKHRIMLQYAEPSRIVNSLGKYADPFFIFTSKTGLAEDSRFRALKLKV